MLVHDVFISCVYLVCFVVSSGIELADFRFKDGLQFGKVPAEWWLWLCVEAKYYEKW